MTAMTTPVRRSSPWGPVLRAEGRLFRREPGNWFGILGAPSLLLVILGSIPGFRKPVAGLGGLRLIDVYVPTLVLIAVIVTGLQLMPPVITGYRERGILRRLSVTPVRPATVLTVQMGLHGAAALVSILICLTIGRLAFDVRLPRQGFGYALALLLTVAVALSLGALVSARARTVKIASAVSTAIFFPSMFTAGLWVPVRSMPHVLQEIVLALPFGAASRVLEQAASGAWPSWSHLGVLAAWAVILSAAASRWFRWQ